MANLMKMKRSSVPGKVPTTADLDLGEIAINTYDGKVYMKKNVSGVETVVLLTGAGAGDVVGPSSSADNAIARFDLTSGKIIQNSSATIDDSGNLSSLTQNATGTGANTMPVGTTAQRPATPTAGMYRMNSSTGTPEWYDSGTSSWVPFNKGVPYTIDYLVVAGGGGASAGGAGAGGYRSGSMTVYAGDVMPVIVGAGGAASGSYQTSATNGEDSSFGGIVSIGGGRSGGALPSPGASSGGSGGGGHNANGGAAGTTGQGNAGGAGWTNNVYSTGGGGGGAGAAGVAASGNAGAGGAGLNWLSLGTFRAGGGGGSNDSRGGAGAAGGSGGGGAGSYGGGSNGTANTGGGGGGGGYNGGGWTSGGNGGSGVVIVRYSGTPRASGGTITQSGGYTYHTFNSSANYTA